MFSQQPPNKAGLMTNLYQTTRNYYDVFGCYHTGIPIDAFFPQVLSQLKSLPPWFRANNTVPDYPPFGLHPTFPTNNYPLTTTTLPPPGQSTIGMPFQFQHPFPSPTYHHPAPPVAPIGPPPNQFYTPPHFSTTLTTPPTANAVSYPGAASLGMAPFTNQQSQEIMQELRNLQTNLRSTVRSEIRRMTTVENNGRMPPTVETAANGHVAQDDISDITLGIQNGNQPLSDPARAAGSVVSTASSQTRTKYVTLLKVRRPPSVSDNYPTVSMALEFVNREVYCSGSVGGHTGQISRYSNTSRVVKKANSECMYINVRCSCYGNHPPLRISQKTLSATQLHIECPDSHLSFYQNHFHRKFSPEEYIQSILDEGTFGVWSTHHDLYLFVIERIFTLRQQDEMALDVWTNLICGVDSLGASKVRDIIESHLSRRVQQQPARVIGNSDYSPSPGNTGQGILDYVRTNSISRFMETNKHQQLASGQVTFANLSDFISFWNFESPSQVLALPPNCQRYAHTDFQQNELDEVACNVIFICPAHIYAAYNLLSSATTKNMGFYMIDGKFKLHRTLGGNGGVLIHFGACDLNVHNWPPNNFTTPHAQKCIRTPPFPPRVR